MNIKVIGMGCDKCDTLYANTLEAVAQSGVQADVEKVEDLLEIVKLGVMSAPSLMINGKLVISGSVASVKNIIGLLEKHKGGN